MKDAAVAKLTSVLISNGLIDSSDAIEKYGGSVNGFSIDSGDIDVSLSLNVSRLIYKNSDYRLDSRDKAKQELLIALHMIKDKIG